MSEPRLWPATFGRPEPAALRFAATMAACRGHQLCACGMSTHLAIDSIGAPSAHRILSKGQLPGLRTRSAMEVKFQSLRGDRACTDRRSP